MAKISTLYIVAYDIPNDQRRTKMHKLLKGFGQWTQFSIFECWLTDVEILRLRDRVSKLLKESEDHVRIYPLCASCVKKVETIGAAPPQEATLFLV